MLDSTDKKKIVIADGGFKEGLKGFFSQQKELALVFLNGCSTQGHVDALLAALDKR